MMEATALKGPDPASSVSLDPANMTMSSGCGSLVESVTWCLTEPGDGVIIPSPYYPAFDNDCVVRAACVVVPAETDQALYRLTVQALDAAAAKSVATGHTPKLLILTNPSNPLGVSYSEEELADATKW
jgi:1-aminocyclopropane-1-carboxylate synthase